MEKKRIWALGLAALLIAGLALAVDLGNWRKQGARCADMKEELGLSADSTPEEVRDALWDKQLKDLGLSEKSTVGELRAAMKERRQAMWMEKLSEMKEKLGLPEAASEEEVREALKEKQGERQGYPHMRGFHGRG